MSGIGNNPNLNSLFTKLTSDVKSAKADGNIDEAEAKKLVNDGVNLANALHIDTKDLSKFEKIISSQMDPHDSKLVFDGIKAKLKGDISAELEKSKVVLNEGTIGNLARATVEDNPTIAKIANFIGVTDRDETGFTKEQKKSIEEVKSSSTNKFIESTLQNENNKNLNARDFHCVRNSLKSAGFDLKSQPDEGAVLNIKNLKKWTGENDFSVGSLTSKNLDTIKNLKNKNAPIIELGAHVESFKNFDKDGNIQTASGRLIKKEDFSNAKVYVSGKDALGKGSSSVEISRGTQVKGVGNFNPKGTQDQVATAKLLHLFASPEKQSDMANILGMVRKGANIDQVSNLLKTLNPPIEFKSEDKLAKMITLMKTDVSDASPIKGPSGQTLIGADGKPKKGENMFKSSLYLAKHNMSNNILGGIEKMDPAKIEEIIYSHGNIKDQASKLQEMVNSMTRDGDGC